MGTCGASVLGAGHIKFCQRSSPACSLGLRVPSGPACDLEGEIFFVGHCPQKCHRSLVVCSKLLTLKLLPTLRAGFVVPSDSRFAAFAHNSCSLPDFSFVTP